MEKYGHSPASVEQTRDAGLNEDQSKEETLNRERSHWSGMLVIKTSTSHDKEHCVFLVCHQDA